MPKLIPYKLSFEERSGYLYARVEAKQTSTATSKAYLAEVRAECNAHRSTRLMIDRRIPHVMSVIGFYNVFGNSVETFRGIKVAWLNPYPENQEMLEFAMTAANNRGARYALFRDEREAEEWLLDHQDSGGASTRGHDNGDRSTAWLSD
jgi:hypothetical protein